MWNEISRGLRARDSSPVVTWLSPVGRIELSGRTLLNAISKAGNYLIDGCDFDSSTSIRVELGNHWQAPVFQLAALVSGVGLSDQSENIFGFIDSETFNAKYVVSRDPFGMPEKNVPESSENVSLEVRSHGDYFAPSFSLGEIAAQLAGEKASASQLLDLVQSTIAKHNITGRFGLVTKSPTLESLILQALVPALTSHGVVLLDGVDADSNSVTAEKITQVIEL